MKYITNTVKSLLLAIAVSVGTFAATNELVLEWTHQFLPKVIPGFDPSGSPVIVTNPPVTFYFYVSTNLTNWSLLTIVEDTNKASIFLDSEQPQFVSGCFSNRTYGVSKFSHPFPIPPESTNKTITITKPVQ